MIINDGTASSTTISDAVKKEIALMAHPVGSYYWSSEKTSPQTLFGGTWTPVEDRFVYAAKQSAASGTTGGAATVTLTAAQMPGHTHAGPSHTHTTGNHSHTVYGIHAVQLEATGYALWKAEPVSGWLKGYDDRTMVASLPNQKAEGYNPSASPQRYDITAAAASAGTTGASGTAATGSTGGGGAHENMPPYITAYCWRRTA